MIDCRCFLALLVATVILLPPPVVLSPSPHSHQLEELYLASNGIDDAGLSEPATGVGLEFKSLSVIDFSKNKIEVRMCNKGEEVKEELRNEIQF
jgi:hypothetical protein